MRSIVIGVFFCIFFLVLVSCSDQGQPSSSSTVPNATSTPTTGAIQTTPRALVTSLATQTKTQIKVSSIITYFYQAIESKNYSTAFSYLGSDAQTVDGKKLTSDAFLHQALSMDGSEGRVNSFIFMISTDNPPQVLMTLTRTSGLYYYAHLQLKQEKGKWKIKQLDRI